MTRDDETILLIARQIGERLIQEEVDPRELLGENADPGLLEHIFASQLTDLTPRERTALIAYARDENVLMAVMPDHLEVTGQRGVII